MHLAVKKISAEKCASQFVCGRCRKMLINHYVKFLYSKSPKLRLEV